MEKKMDPKQVLAKANKEWALALAEDEIDYLIDAFLKKHHRNPTDVELMVWLSNLDVCPG